jgi:hypothetical protein
MGSEMMSLTAATHGFAIGTPVSKGWWQAETVEDESERDSATLALGCNHVNEAQLQAWAPIIGSKARSVTLQTVNSYSESSKPDALPWPASAVAFSTANRVRQQALQHDYFQQECFSRPQ